MPEKSAAVLYGNLSNDDIGSINPMSFMSKQQTIESFTLNFWIETKGLFKLNQIVNKVKKFLTGNLKTNIQKEFPFSQIEEAMKFYKSNMTKGKILLKPDSVFNKDDESKDEKKEELSINAESKDSEDNKEDNPKDCI